MDTNNLVWIVLILSAIKILKRFVSLSKADYPVIIKHEMWSDFPAVIAWMILLFWCLNILSS